MPRLRERCDARPTVRPQAAVTQVRRLSGPALELLENCAIRGYPVVVVGTGRGGDAEPSLAPSALLGAVSVAGWASPGLEVLVDRGTRRRGLPGVVGVREQEDGEPGLHRVLRRPGVVRGEERAIVDHNRLVAVPADQSCEGEFAPDRCRRARLDRRQHSSRQSEHTDQREHRADPRQKVALHPGPSAPIDRCL